MLDAVNFFEVIEKATAKEVYGRALVELGAKDERVVVLAADLIRTNKLADFQKVYPDRCFNVGIAEQNMMLIAAGLALDGRIPFVSTMASFASMRACEQVRTGICYPNLNVRIVATNAGLTGAGGPTHAGQEDIAIMRSMVNMTVISPGDPNQIAKVVSASMDVKGPVYIRIGRGGEPVVYHDDYTYEIGKAIKLKEGNDISIIATGIMVSFAKEAAEELGKEGIHASVIDMHTLKPIDEDAILKEARNTGIILTCEDHNVTGGLGSIVAEV